MANQGKLKLSTLAAYTGVILGIIIWFGPNLTLLITSFKPPDLVASRKLVVLFRPTFENYRYIFMKGNFFLYLLNSAVIAACSSTIVVSAGVLAAYSIARFRTGGTFFAFWVLLTHLIPAVVFTVPFFIIFSETGLINTWWAVILAHMLLTLAFVVWVMRGFFEDIPIEIEESARIDGASRFQVFIFITLPIVRPGILVCTILAVLFSWNEFVYTSILAFTPLAKTLPVASMDFITAYTIQWGPMFGSGVLIMIPVMVFVLVMQKYMVRGLTFGAIK